MVHTTSIVLIATVALNGASAWGTPISQSETSVQSRSIEELSDILGRDLDQREIDELDSRGMASSIGKIAKTGMRYAGKALPWVAGAASMIPTGGSSDDKKQARSIEEWSEIFGRDLDQREIDELYARGMASSIGKIAKTGMKYAGKALPWVAGAASMIPTGGSSDDKKQARSIEEWSEIFGRELDQREIDELHARGMASSIGKVAKTGMRYAGKALPWVAGAASMIPTGGSSDDKKQARSIEELSEIFGRELDQREIDELHARGMASSIGKAAKTGMRWAGNALPIAAAAAPFIPTGGGSGEQKQARSIEEWSEIFGRELDQREIDELHARGMASSIGKIAKTGMRYAGKALPWVAGAASMIPTGGSSEDKKQARSIEEWSEIFGRDLDQREIDELYARGMASSIGKIAKTGMKYAGKALPWVAGAASMIPTGGSSEDKKQARSVEEWSQILGRDVTEAEAILARELEGLIAREFDALNNLD